MIFLGYELINLDLIICSVFNMYVLYSLKYCTCMSACINTYSGKVEGEDRGQSNKYNQ